jgi:hypothetical protein
MVCLSRNPNVPHLYFGPGRLPLLGPVLKIGAIVIYSGNYRVVEWNASKWIDTGDKKDLYRTSNSLIDKNGNIFVEAHCRRGDLRSKPFRIKGMPCVVEIR